MIVRGGGGGTVMGPVFKGENQADGAIRNRKNDRIENPSTSSDADFLVCHDYLDNIIFDR